MRNRTASGRGALIAAGVCVALLILHEILRLYGDDRPREGEATDAGRAGAPDRVDIGSGVSVRFPAPAVSEVRREDGGCGPVDIRYFSARGGGLNYSARVRDAVGAAPGDEQGLLDRFSEDLSQGASDGVKWRPARAVEYRGRPAREIEATEGSGRTSMRVVHAGQRLVFLYVSGPSEDALPARAVQSFFDSLDITPDPGEGPLGQGLLEARRGFATTLIPNAYQADGPPPRPPPRIFGLVRYDAPPGKLAAYVTPDPKDGKKHPAMLWAHGGFGGIGDHFWTTPPPDNDQTARAFREAGIVLMTPSWRGENDNPGKFELFYGEVEDFLAARDHLASLPYVDPERIYVGGHSTGGTMTLLLAESTTRFRAAFSFGGAPNVASVVADGRGYGNTPFDCRSRLESRLRSAVFFVSAIRRPTFYFEGDSGYAPEALEMKKRADLAGVPFEAFPVKGGDHFSILDPLTRLVARKVLEDTAASDGIRITAEEVAQAFSQRRRAP